MTSPPASSPPSASPPAAASTHKLVLATRRSALALAQARAFARDLASAVAGLSIEELQVVTSGDKATSVPLHQIGGKGLFTKEIEEALLDHRADFAVHSFKDVPAHMVDSLTVGCVPRRVEPHDVLVGRLAPTLDELPKGARVGTSSLRRRVQLQAMRPDLVLLDLRGNVDTRLRKLDAGELDAIVLARAGLVRLGLAQRITEVFPPERMTPAPGQGALAIQCRVGDERTRSMLGKLDHAPSRIAVACERGVMVQVGGDCSVPFGAYACRDGESLWVRAFLAAGAGEGGALRLRWAERRVSWPASEVEAVGIGREVGAELGPATS